MAECEENFDKNLEEGEAKDSKKNQHPVHQFITFDKNKYICKLCDHVFSNSHSGNMRKHVERNHKEQNEVLQRALHAYYSDERRNQKGNDRVKAKKRARNRFGPRNTNSITVVHDIADVKLGFVEMCSVNMWPFKQLRHSGLSRIVAPIIQQSRRCGIPLSNQPEAIEEYSISEQLKIADIIRDELNGKLFSIMIDATTTQSRSILGIAAQYIQGGQVVVRTLGMRRMMEDHSGASLSKILKTVLYEFGVNPAMVYAITTDNEKSVIKCVKDTEVNDYEITCRNLSNYRNEIVVMTNLLILFCYKGQPNNIDRRFSSG